MMSNDLELVPAVVGDLKDVSYLQRALELVKSHQYKDAIAVIQEFTLDATKAVTIVEAWVDML